MTPNINVEDSYQKYTPPIAYNYNSLPYHELDWGRLENLCHDLNCLKYGVEKCFQYGKPGQKQQGFDCYVRTGQDRYILFQCKNVLSFKRTDLKKAIKIWENGTWFDKTEKFVLFSSEGLRDTTFLDEFELHHSRLSDNQIELEAWGNTRIDDELRNYPQLVQQFFGQEWRDKFCNPLALKNYLGAFQPDNHHKCIAYQAVQFYIPRRLINQNKTIEVYKGLTQSERISLPNHINSRLAENKLTRIIIKASAAIGKTKELENLGHIYSLEKDGLFPILIPLKNFQGDLNTHISYYYKKWTEILPERLLLLFDGLDEVPAAGFNDFIKKFNLFVQSNNRVNIVATIRTNVFNSDIGSAVLDKDKLDEFYLGDIEEDEIEQYISDKIPSIQVRNKCYIHFRKKWIRELLVSPFYLSALTDLFLEDQKKLPANRVEVIEKIIVYKLQQDKKKYTTEINTPLIRIFANKLAVYLTLTGKNTILESLLPSFGNLTLMEIQRCSLFKVESTDLESSISFEHNNFQEYLAAVSLSTLEWKNLEPILFHITGIHILKPKMLNTVNYLFTVLPSDGVIFKNLFQLIWDTEKELFLKFEKDKISSIQRLEIFQQIILKGKEEGVYYLGGDFRLEEFCEFINYSAEAFRFLVHELKTAKEDNHLYCLLDILYYFEQVKITPKLRTELLKEAEFILKSPSYPYAVYDRTIDILTRYKFFNNRLLKLVKNVSLHQHKMVRGAIIKYIDEGGFTAEFKYVIESNIVLTNTKDSISAGLEPFYLNYVIKHLNLENAITLLKHLKSLPERIKEITGYEGYSEEFRLINKIYKALGELFQTTENSELYTLFTDFLIAVHFEDYKMKEWGDPRFFFIMQKHKDRYFWDYLKHKEWERLSYFLSVLYEPELGKEIIEKYRLGEVSDYQIRMIRLYLDTPDHQIFQQHLIENFGDTFKFPEQPDWERIKMQRESKNLDLLQDHILFLQEAKNVYQIVQEYKGTDPEDEFIFELENSERGEIQRRLNNTIILQAIHDYDIKGDFREFQKCFNKEGWEWYVFQRVGVYLKNNKKKLTEPLVNFAERYLLNKMLPNINFDKAVKELKDGSFTVSNDANHLINFFVHDGVTLTSLDSLSMLKIDYYGFLVGSDNKKEKKIYQLVYEKTDLESFKNQLISNLQNASLADRVITTQAKACLDYNIQEGLTYMLHLLDRNSFSNRYKEHLVNIIIELADGPEIFEDIIFNISKINNEWQFKICKFLLERNYEVAQLRKLIQSTSMNTSIKTNELYWKFELLEMAIKLGSRKATSYLFNTFYKKSKTSNFLNIKSSFFTSLAIEDPEYLLEFCFQTLKHWAPNINDSGRKDLPEMIEEIIRNCAATNQKLFHKSLKEYENIIKTFMPINPKISYIKWYERRLVSSYLTSAVAYENHDQAMHLVYQLA